MALNFNTLLVRTLTAAVFVAVLISAISFGFITFSVLFFIISIWGLQEFYKIAEKLGAGPFKMIGFLSAILLLAGAFFQNSGLQLINPLILYSAGLCVASFAFVGAMFSKSNNPLTDAVYTLAGLVYCITPFVLLSNISCVKEGIVENGAYNLNSTYNHHLILGLFFLIWANDSYAYLVGSLIGKNKLYERISPGKTWEGTIGAALLTAASSFLIAKWFPELAFFHWLIISMIVAIVGTLGDLSESMLKRQAGIKDSGRIMPGHGGILDRFDSLMFIAPVVYFYLILVSS